MPWAVPFEAACWCSSLYSGPYRSRTTDFQRSTIQDRTPPARVPSTSPIGWREPETMVRRRLGSHLHLGPGDQTQMQPPVVGHRSSYPQRWGIACGGRLILACRCGGHGGDDSLMTLQDLPASLSMIAERHLARAKAALEELGIDTAGMPPAEIFDRAQGEGASAGHPLKPESLERESE